MMNLYPLLDHLAAQPEDGQWHDWDIQRIAGGANGLVYHASGEARDFAVKFTLRGQRQRADREYQALSALAKTGLDIAPEPILLDQSRYPLDVVVQSWLVGTVTETLPETDAEWQRLVEHFATIHRQTPDSIGQTLQPAVLNVATPDQGRAIVQWQIDHLPEDERPPELRSLWSRLQSHPFPDWGDPPVRLVRGDPNTRNIVRRAGSWASVDWENSGWGDAAFEIADMMIHPAYMAVPAARWDWVIGAYARLTDDPGAELRIRAYYGILSVWWVARLARFLYEIPRGLDPRLAQRPADWQAETQQKFDHYLNLAENLMEH